MLSLLHYHCFLHVYYITYSLQGYWYKLFSISFKDIHPNPGPHRKRCSTPKYPCDECQHTVANKEDAKLCAEYETWFHTKCIHMGKYSFQYYLVNYNLDWTCFLCSLRKFGNSFFDHLARNQYLSCPMLICTANNKC